MKLNFKYAIMAVAALTMGLTSCSNDDDTTEVAGNKAKLNISIASPETKAVATSPSDVVPVDEIKNFMAFVVDGANLHKAYSSDGTALADSNAITTSTSASAVYVIANAGDLTSQINTLAQLTGYVADLDATNAGSQMGTYGRWATGQAAFTSTDFVQSGSDFVATKTVTLTFIAARITVKVVNQMDNYGATGSVVLNSVAVMNARGESLLFPASEGTSLIPSTFHTGKSYYEGLADDSFTYYPLDFSMETSLLSNTLSDVTNDTYYYYVFENNATTPSAYPTIVTLVGTKSDGKPIYWPVHLASYESWASGSMTAGVLRGNSYDITINLTGDAVTGGGGTEDPTYPIVNGSVNVSVELTPWTAVPLDKEFK